MVTILSLLVLYIITCVHHHKHPAVPHKSQTVVGFTFVGCITQTSQSSLTSKSRKNKNWSVFFKSLITFITQIIFKCSWKLSFLESCRVLGFFLGLLRKCLSYTRFREKSNKKNCWIRLLFICFTRFTFFR